MVPISAKAGTVRQGFFFVPYFVRDKLILVYYYRVLLSLSFIVYILHTAVSFVCTCSRFCVL